MDKDKHQSSSSNKEKNPFSTPKKGQNYEKPRDTTAQQSAKLRGSTTSYNYLGSQSKK